MVTRPDEAADANASESFCATRTSTVRDPEVSGDVADRTDPVTTSGALSGSTPVGGEMTR